MSSDRLPAQPGEWIDRQRPIRFHFEGQSYSGLAGDCIASALWANGVRMLGRSFKYHRPRGIYSLANHDVNNMLEAGGKTNIRADVTPLTEGLDARAVNTVGSLAGDWGRLVELGSRFLPVGFYYKAFHTPRRLFPWYERKMRAMAGLGAINPSAPRVRSPKSYDWCDVLVIGAGPAGLSAAIAAGEAGARVILVDENPHAGGSLGYQFGSDAGAAGKLEVLLTRLAQLPNIAVHLATQAVGYYADHWVALVNPQRMSKVRTQSSVIATGCYELPSVFHNNDLPGVMLASAAQRLIARYAVRPFARGVVLTANSDGYRAALDLRRAGVEVPAVVDLRPQGEATPLAAQVAQAGITVHLGQAIYQAHPASGKTGITGVTVCPLDGSGQPDPVRGMRIDCDGVAMSVAWSGADNLLCMAGVQMGFDQNLQQYLPQVLGPGLFAAGRVNGIFALEDQLADGRHAGQAAAVHVGKAPAGGVAAVPARQGPSPSHPFPIFDHPAGKNFIDLDEDVQVKDIVNAVQEGFDSIELLKRYSTFGMGPSQGKIVNANVARLLARIKGQPVGGTPTSRPFYQPVSLAQLAGRGFHPHRHTPMHHWHEQAGAQWILAGAWQRPAFYGKDRQQAISEEVRAVRNGVALIDVSTLGKIGVSGPDAVELLERLYTGRFAKMKAGTTRYLLMCDESGVVVDDGVGARVADDRFYVTCTTTGADAIYREMQRWVQVWNLQVTLVNMTGALGAMNVAGPLSRTLLASLTSADLSNEAFPYLGYRQAVVAGVPARLMRVGFVGELGYEVHVPAQSALHVWHKLIEAGKAHGIRPFGVEAQRVLRLEKAHIIVGQDTDGLTHPYEAALEWAIKDDKPFFLGQRSLQAMGKKPLTRRLVGFTLAKDFHGPLPKECHLVIDRGTITGRVTSIAASPTLGQVVGMAYVSVEQAAVGNSFRIRGDDGLEVEASIVPIPFYDPEGLRQKLAAPAAVEAR